MPPTSVSALRRPLFLFTKHYWDLFPYIFFYGDVSLFVPFPLLSHAHACSLLDIAVLPRSDMYTASGIHSDNETSKATTFVNEIHFFSRLILNVDESEILE